MFRLVMKCFSGRPISGVVVGLLLASSLIGCNKKQATSSGDGNAAGDGTPVSDAGSLDALDCQSAQGWAWDRARPDDAVSVDILDGKTLLETVKADALRQDLATAGKGNGKHGFKYVLPGAVHDGKPHEIHAVLTTSKAELNFSPRSITCPGQGTP